MLVSLGPVIKRFRYYAPLLLGLVFIGSGLQRWLAKEPSVDPMWEKTLVSIEIADGAASRPHGIGLLVSTDASTNPVERILVTARHLIASLSPELRGKLGYRYRTASGGSAVILDRDLIKDGAGDWTFHSEADVACRLFGTYRDGDTLTMPTNLFLPSQQLRTGAKVFLTRSSEGTNDVSRLKFEKGAVGALGESVEIKAPVKPGYDGGPVVYVPDSRKVPLTWNLAVVGLISAPKITPPAAQATESEQIPFTTVPAERVCEVVQRFQEQRRAMR